MELLGTESFMLVCLCVVFPMTPIGGPAVGIIQGDVFMNWEISIPELSLPGVVSNPNGDTLFVYRSAILSVNQAFSNRVKDNGSSISLGRISFYLLNLSVTDAGRYYYKIFTDVGGQVLVISGNPANISVMDVGDRFEDKTYTMQCSAQSTSVPLGMNLTMHYQWKRENGQYIIASDRYFFSSDQSTLIIKPLKRQDAGTFVCEAWEHVEAVSQSDPFSLKVIYGPDSNGTTLSPSNTSYQLTESSSFTVQCTAICVPQCNYQWMGPGISQNDNQGLLNVSGMSRNQSGVFSCTVTNPKNPVKSVTANVSVQVYYGPDDRNVSLSPSNTSYQLTELSPLDVNCSATCQPQCTYQWSGPGRVSQNDSMGSLSISQIQRNQNGTFICTVTNPKVPGKSATANFSIIVYYGPDSNGTSLSPSNTSYQLTESSLFTVQCTAICVPQCNYQWMGPGISQNDNQGVLSVSKVSRNQSGTFTCTVTNPKNPGKSVTANFSIVVYYGPDDKSVSLSPSNTSYQLTELSRLDVNCSATCEPQCNYQWSGPGLVSQNDNMGWLSISQIQRNQNGTFICTVTNSKVPGKFATANFSIIVYYGPDSNGTTLSPSNTSYHLTELSPLDVQCSATCFPQCIYEWMGPAINKNYSNGLLSISNVSRNQAGIFACTVTNPWMPGKSATANFSLIVYYPPVLTMKATNSSKGGRVVINCTASGVPDNYTFYKLTHVAPDVSRTIVRDLELTRVSNNEVSFTIERATYQDTGYYVCKASNGILYYNSGQLVMEYIVSVWITDQPVFTSNIRDFYAEKGKAGKMYIEFYTGLLQPFVTWYLDKNGSMEQNSSNFGMYLSAVTVEVKYYQGTVRLPGYNASLEVISVDQEHFTSYMVEINDSFAKPVYETLELKPRGPPETPANLSVVPESITTHSIQLSWCAGFHGGDTQTFVIEYKEAGTIIWQNKEEQRGLVQYITLNATITDLKAGTMYEFRIYSKNVYDRSKISTIINETTKIVIRDELVNSNESPVLIGAATGSALALVIAVVIVGLYFYKRRQSIKSSEEDSDVLQDKKHFSHRHKSGLLDNPVYDSSGPLPDPSTCESATGVEYAAVVKQQTKGVQAENNSNLYAQVDKTKHVKNKGQEKQTPRKAQRDEIYENAILAGRDNLKGNNYENSGDENIYENPSEKEYKGPLAKTDGLVYADLALDSLTTNNGKYVIRGLENRTEYAEIAYGKRGKPHPDDEKEINY